MTSSPGPSSSALKTSTSASVPLPTPIVCGTPRYVAASSSNAFTFGPRTNCPPSSTSSRTRFSSGSSGAYCALTSTSGICGTASNPRGAPPQTQVGEAQHGDGDDGVVGVVERLVEPLPVRPERPAHAGEAEAPHRRSGNRQRDVAAERH